ncbi:MAG TPA: RidA family protein [Candidatus Binataceae bacterium]|nr:RidA family protein [Candidatus Binataceae bacterium]
MASSGRKTRKPGTKAKPRAVRSRSTAKPVVKPARRTRIDPGWAWDDVYPLSQGIQSGQMIFVSGQVAFGPDGNVVGAGDIKAQTHQAFKNVAAVLAKAGAALKDIVKITSFLTDENSFGQMLEARREVFGAEPPASTAVVVKRLVMPELLIEIEAIAIKP